MVSANQTPGLQRLKNEERSLEERWKTTMEMIGELLGLKGDALEALDRDLSEEDYDELWPLLLSNGEQICDHMYAIKTPVKDLLA